MSKLKVVLAAGVTFAALAGLAACSKSGSAPADSSAASAPAAQPAPAADAAPTDYGTATKPGDGKLKLDIKVGSGDAVYGDPTSGKTVFTQCMTCHSKDAGDNKVGPSLHGIIGRHSGAVPNFNYSAANKSSGKVWTEQELYSYLENPQKSIPGTYMTYTGVKDPQKRADIIAFLQENTK